MLYVISQSCPKPEIEGVGGGGGGGVGSRVGRLLHNQSGVDFTDERVRKLLPPVARAVCS